jgi:Fe-S oxidoreductase
MTLMRDLVLSGRLAVDPTRNDFPVTLHDPCNMTRLMGMTEPQRLVLRAVCPDVRENLGNLYPHRHRVSL